MWTYIKDAKTGLHKEFYSNGQLKTSHHVVNEQILQVYGCFTPQGEAFKCGTLKMGQGTLVVLDDEGNVIREDFYENGVRKELSEDH
jgi:antitoxin component YwqK of YwqJK toxin-antitoxin module